MYFFLLLVTLSGQLYADADVLNEPVDVTVELTVQDSHSEKEVQAPIAQVETSVSDIDVMQHTMVKEPAVTQETIDKQSLDGFTAPSTEQDDTTLSKTDIPTTANTDPSVMVPTAIEQGAISVVEMKHQVHDPIKEEPKKITVINSITQEQITYNHWSGSYVPEFTLTVENESVAFAQTKDIEITKKSITLSYKAQFPNQRSSQDDATIELQENTKQISVNFDWQSNPRLKIEQL